MSYTHRLTWRKECSGRVNIQRIILPLGYDKGDVEATLQYERVHERHFIQHGILNLRSVDPATLGELKMNEIRYHFSVPNTVQEDEKEETDESVS